MNLKTITLLIITIAITIHRVNAQEMDDELIGLDAPLFDLNKYMKEEVPSDFPTTFESKESLQNYKRLRDYKSQKEILIRALSRYEVRFYNSKSILEEIRNLKSTLTSFSETNKPEKEYYIIPPDKKSTISPLSDYYNLPRQIEQVYFSTFKTYGRFEYLQSTTEIKEVDTLRIPVGDFDKLLNLINQQETIFDIQTKSHDFLTKNIETIKLDLVLCEVQLDRTLGPEYNRQNFKENISLYFTILIGILLILFFFIVHQKSGADLSKELLGGNGLQFITLFVLIIAVILFGILEILQGSELAAILAGISGYILGKGVQISSTKDPNAS